MVLSKALGFLTSIQMFSGRLFRESEKAVRWSVKSSVQRFHCRMSDGIMSKGGTAGKPRSAMNLN